jgi:hypothetical protein
MIEGWVGMGMGALKACSYYLFITSTHPFLVDLTSHHITSPSPQGSGKGTLSARLVQKYDLHFISTGDVLRREILQKSEIGREAEEVVKSGGLVGDDLMLRIIEGELDKLHGKVSFSWDEGGIRVWVW